VSGNVTLTRSGEIPSSSATICASEVCVPCPISTLLVNNTAEPSALSRTTAEEFDGVIVVLIITANPLPRTLPLGTRFSCSAFPFHLIASAAPLRQSAIPTDTNLSPVTNTSPSCTRFFNLISNGSIPSRLAMSSICDSYAQQTCGTPNPRYGPVGGVFVYTQYVVKS
jgi:hypothetical protein